MIKIWSDCIYYYGICDVLKNTFRVSLQLVDKINVNAMQKALELAQKRYPYFSVKRVKTFREIALDNNDLPWILKEGVDALKLGSSESNYHLIAFCYQDDWLYVDIFHGLSDASGVMNILRTLLYYYCLEVYGEIKASSNFKLVGDEITDEEICDPYLKLPKQEKDKNKKKNKKEKKEYLSLADESGYVQTKQYAFKLVIPQNDLMKYCGDNDGSPATAIGLFTARAINKLHKDSDKLIGCGIATNLRPALGVKESHHSTISMPALEFSKKIAKKDIMTQGTAFRGQVLLKCGPDSLQDALQSTNEFYGMLDSIPVRVIKEKIMSSLVKLALKGPTFTVSYVGKCEFGDCEKYVKQVYTEPDSPGTGIMIELNFANGNFYATFMQEWKEDTYFKAFLEELKENNIAYSIKSEGFINIADIKK